MLSADVAVAADEWGADPIERQRTERDPEREVGRRCDEDGEEDDQKRGYRQVATHEPQCSLPNTSAVGTGRSLGLWPVDGYPGAGVQWAGRGYQSQSYVFS